MSASRKRGQRRLKKRRPLRQNLHVEVDGLKVPTARPNRPECDAGVDREQVMARVEAFW